MNIEINAEHFKEKELSEQEQEYKRILEDKNMIYLGIQRFDEGQEFVVFKTNDKLSWSNGMSIPVEDFNEDSVDSKIEETKKKFNIKE